MSGLWLMAGISFREAARRKILWTALIVGSLLLAIFAAGLRLQLADFNARPIAPFLRYQVMSAMVMVGLYTLDLLALVMTVLTSVDAISGEISSGTIHAIATKPIARWEILAGKWFGFAAMIGAYLAIMFSGTVAISYWVGGIAPDHSLRGALLIYLECLVALSVTFMFGTWFSTLTNGVLALGLCGFAFMGGWIEQMSGFTQSSRLVTLGIVSSLVMPTEAIWRRAVFEMQSPLAGSLQFTPFADVSVPSGAMILYAGIFGLAALAIAIFRFARRDL
jgi:Cu-processing system permease protein